MVMGQFEKIRVYLISRFFSIRENRENFMHAKYTWFTVSCFRCGETGHKSYDCKANKRGQTQQAAAMQVLEPSTPTTQQTGHNVCNENHKWTEYSGPKEGEVQLACGSGVSVSVFEVGIGIRYFAIIYIFGVTRLQQC